MTRRILTVGLLVAAVSCRPVGERAARGDSGAKPEAASAARPDSGRIAVVGPTLVVFFAGAYAVADSGGDAAETLGDLEYHLGSARPALDSLGVAVIERYGKSVEYTLDGVVGRFEPAPDSGRAGYLFLRPGTPAQVHYGVLTDIDLVDAVRTRLGLPRAAGRR
ncbi:MAG: hypothetical protein ACJ8AD_09190 [Gemmatimonadaceae bacterium]